MTRITAERLAQHIPPGSQSLYAAIIDVAQDLLLAPLHADGMFDHLVFKGCTALRKLSADSAGRFSTDLDFSVRIPEGDPVTVAAVLPELIEGRSVDAFVYHIEDHRGRAAISYETPFGDGGMRTKLDIGPAPWLPSEPRGWVHLEVHDAYQLPASIPVMALAENLAEKIARLSRRTPDRDVYDLVRIARKSPDSGFDRKLVQRVSILKTWVDQHGLSSSAAGWRPVPGAIAYDPTVWSRVRASSDFDDESVGMRAVPAPKLSDLATAMLAPNSFRGEPDGLERDILVSGAAGRSLVIAQIRSLPGQRFETRELW